MTGKGQRNPIIGGEKSGQRKLPSVAAQHQSSQSWSHQPHPAHPHHPHPHHHHPHPLDLQRCSGRSSCCAALGCSHCSCCVWAPAVAAADAGLTGQFLHRANRHLQDTVNTSTGQFLHTLCCILLHCAVFCCTVLCSFALCCVLLHCVVFCCTVMSSVVLC